MEFKVRVEKTASAVSADEVTFETGATLEQTLDRNTFAYEHHGEGFPPGTPGSLTRFYEDLILGRPFPLAFATRAIADVDTLFAIALFLHRDLAIVPSTPGIVASVDMAHRLGVAGLAHIDADLAHLIRVLRVYLPEGLSKRELGERLTVSTGWIYSYMLRGELPHAGPTLDPIQILDHGSNGFVVAQTTRMLLDAWVDVYRQGFLRGVVFSPDKDGRRLVLAARKSLFLEFDLHRAAHMLNELETVMGEAAGWEASDLWLRGPTSGTILAPSHMLEVFLRV